MTRAYMISFLLVSGLLLAACGSDDKGFAGSGTGADSDNDDTSGEHDDGALLVTEENALRLLQHATKGVNGIGETARHLFAISERLNSIRQRDEESRKAGYSPVAEASVADCPTGGTLEFERTDNDGVQEARYVADHCADGAGTVYHGEFVFIFDDGAAQAGVEQFRMITGEDGFTSADCTFRGGVSLAFEADTPESSSEGDYSYGAEYLAETGLDRACDSADSFVVEENTSVYNKISYTYSDDQVSDLVNALVVDGEIDNPNGEGSYGFEAEQLEFAADVQGSQVESRYPSEACPEAGALTINAAEDTTATAYFGSDASAGYEVQVIGPDYVEEFESCDDFLN